MQHAQVSNISGRDSNSSSTSSGDSHSLCFYYLIHTMHLRGMSIKHEERMQEVMSPSICEVNSFFMMYFNHLCVWKGKNKVYIFALRVQKKKSHMHAICIHWNITLICCQWWTHWWNYILAKVSGNNYLQSAIKTLSI